MSTLSKLTRSKLTRSTAVVGAGALLAVPTAVLTTAPAHADVERHGACAGGYYEFSVDREGNGFEVSLDLDYLRPNDRFKVVLRHDGKKVLKRTLRADYEGDLDVETWRKNTSGSDTFKFRATKVDGAGGCTGSITVR